MTYQNPAAPRRQVETPKGAAIFMIGAVVLLWALEAIDTVLLGLLDTLGIHAQEPTGWVGILFAPFLHLGFGHLIANTIPLLVLGFLILVGRGGAARMVGSTIISAISSGLSAWVLSPAHTVILGASGVIFGWLTYLLTRGIFARDVKNIVIGVVVFMVYGGVLWGVFPTQAGVSWQAHLGGAIGGVLAAWLMHRRAARKVTV
ncbi:membrane associated rhomboid family serine protease [Propionibacteriaceae bacterium ES.041]|uniref:Rhomboid family intramembrane serine protease n=1 Tax=Enemella evansiae TaxID=2016499 RepID=A0A255G1B7_9ACTN|nr:rhomboid family intramembrane serine protease [Enemella evansiae]PFG66554.1 membrane associated rhomboid family serine protease [Propionibacteriaceae bacterium ES.041]OYN93397.1 rhomboid family intramembrane serine protease [Enemella evansiae]OYN97389.1 rhomboid family intramembrane serine protease [Enemella evansiae]OYO07963.1 rhomboid family intramembrane serine protease [Enemella evansiae]OYO14914.1 rhomboid family intramembrane serine protease [Enemella evansiae]